MAVIEAGFISAAAVKNALSHWHDDPWAIARFTVLRDTPAEQVARLLAGQGAPLAWAGERLRTRGFRTARRLAQRARERVEGFDACVGRAGSASRRAAGARPPAGVAAGLLALQAPVAIRSVDLADGFSSVRLPAARSGMPYRGLAVLVWKADAPLGWLGVETALDGEVAGTALANACREQLAIGVDDTVESRVAARHAGAAMASVGVASTAAAELFVSHVVTTCNQPELTIRCLQSILASEDGRFEVVVVENRPERSSVRGALRTTFPGSSHIRIVEEPVAGLSRARNAGVGAARGDIIAFTDDDIVVDGRWAGALRRAFADRPDVTCVTGPILPASLETPAQLLMERFATLGKGFERRSYSIADPPDPAEQPLFPFTAGYFGSGGNAALRRETIVAIGGFDPVLGAGTPARGGEDLDLFIRLLLAGYVLLYEPSAVVWHPHPETLQRLSREVFDYGVGLGSMLTRRVVAGPRRLEFVARIPRGVRYMASPGSRKNANKGSNYPRRLDRLERLGLLLGPAAYVSSRRQAARLRGDANLSVD